MKKSYSHIVIGAGALGTAAAYRLAKAGATDVLVIEQFELGHTQGASEDHSRIIRHSYHARHYSALTPAMFSAWEEVEEESGVQLYYRTGGLDLARIGTEGEAELANYRDTLAEGIGWEDLDAAAIRSRWPQWRIDDDVVGMYQEDGGILDIRKACAAHIALARGRGVEFLPQTRVTGIDETDTHVRVETTAGTFTTESVVLCVASWAGELLPSLGVDWQITLSQEQVGYFATPNLREFAPDRFPIWIWHGERLFYGFPVYGEVAVKVARDLSGRWVTVDSRTHEPLPEETELLADFLRTHLPRALGPELVSKTCVYDLPADRDFILDKLPGHPRITVGIGAGHAAKFASLLGEILAELAVDGRSKYPIDGFRADRPALTDPDREPTFRLQG
ncbi:N-methyl-L-tryptophan oxidase [Streptomyces sp. NPDC004838]